MSPQIENFESLRRLLALKRHEQPPPGYFENFSRQVIVRIQAGERGEDASGFGRWLLEGAWLQRFWDAFETKPALAGAFGVVVCGLLISGVIYSDQPASSRGQGLTVITEPVETPIQSSFQHPLVAQAAAVEFPSSSGVVTVQAHSTSLFDELPKPEVQKLLWSPGGN
jgi:hypothetical protein